MSAPRDTRGKNDRSPHGLAFFLSDEVMKCVLVSWTMRRCLVWVVLLLSSCTSYRDLLDRGQRLYQENEFGRALANWRALEPDVETLAWEDQARYAHLRGMTDLRLGFNADARHWLAIAQALDALHPGGLDDRSKAENQAALESLNRPIYGLVDAPSVTESQ